MSGVINSDPIISALHNYVVKEVEGIRASHDWNTLRKREAIYLYVRPLAMDRININISHWGRIEFNKYIHNCTQADTAFKELKEKLKGLRECSEKKT